MRLKLLGRRVLLSLPVAFVILLLVLPLGFMVVVSFWKRALPEDGACLRTFELRRVPDGQPPICARPQLFVSIGNDDLPRHCLPDRLH